MLRVGSSAQASPPVQVMSHPARLNAFLPLFLLLATFSLAGCVSPEDVHSETTTFAFAHHFCATMVFSEDVYVVGCPKPLVNMTGAGTTPKIALPQNTTGLAFVPFLAPATGYSTLELEARFLNGSVQRWPWTHIGGFGDGSHGRPDPETGLITSEILIALCDVEWIRVRWDPVGPPMESHISVLVLEADTLVRGHSLGMASCNNAWAYGSAPTR